jgi:AGZA family xanthine/uracil permease-like MFS transporter
VGQQLVSIGTRFLSPLLLNRFHADEAGQDMRQQAEDGGAKASWIGSGDINAFMGLSLDNIAGLVLITAILTNQYGVPADFILKHMIPGTAIGVMVGDLLYFFMALWMMRKLGRSVTAMPLGLDTPSTFGMAFFVLGPAFQAAKGTGLSDQEAARAMWYVGMSSIFLTGLFKVFCAFFSGWARRVFPRAGLLGSLAAIALVLISFLPLLDVLGSPVVGFVALAIVLTSLVAQIPLPGKVPGVVGALMVAGVIHYAMRGMGWIPAPHIAFSPAAGWMPTEWMEAWKLDWLKNWQVAIPYLPVLLPFALATVVGGIDCTESAAAAGDPYPTGPVILVEAVATLAASFCGGVIQTTPYIGHPAYKAMGGRTAYTLATAVAIGLAGLTGGFGYFYQCVPEAAVYPILIFIGLEITAQSFQATPKRHYPAVALACVPALAFLALNFAGQIFGDPVVAQAKIQAPAPAATSPTDPAVPVVTSISAKTLANGKLREQLQTASMLASSFILTSLFWASALAYAIDRRLGVAALFILGCAVMTLLGIIHSPLPGNALFLPIAIPGLDIERWVLPAEYRPLQFQWAAGYAITAAILAAWGWYLRSSEQKRQSAGSQVPAVD